MWDVFANQSKKFDSFATHSLLSLVWHKSLISSSSQRETFVVSEEFRQTLGKLDFTKEGFHMGTLARVTLRWSSFPNGFKWDACGF